MQTVETIARITPGGRLVAKVPPRIKAGEHRVTLVIGETPASQKAAPLPALPVVHVGRWPVNLSLRREDLYNDAGR